MVALFLKQNQSPPV